MKLEEKEGSGKVDRGRVRGGYGTEEAGEGGGTEGGRLE